MKVVANLVLACILAGWLPAHSANNVEEMLMKISMVAYEQSFIGTYVYQSSKMQNTLQIWHRSEGDGFSERILSLNESGREIIRQGNKVRYYLPDMNFKVVENRDYISDGFIRFLHGHIEAINNIYAISLNPSKRMLNRPTQKLTIDAKDAYRYSYAAWLDQKTGLVLRMQILNSDDKVLEQSFFTSLRYTDKIPDEQLLPTYSESNLVLEHAQPPPKGYEAKTLETDWQVMMMPEGYEIMQSQMITFPMSKIVMEQLVFTDGLSTASVYIGKMDAYHGKPFQGKKEMGTTNIYGRRLDDYQIMVVAEAPLITAETIGMSIKKRQ